MKPLNKPVHTPGPWQCLTKLSGSENHKGYRIACEARNWWIADVSPIDTDGKEGAANAALIAAAPELLEALERFVSAELAFLASVKPGVIDDHLSDAYKLALAAIRKAKGE